jgi:flavin reductase (DIM6/NTAB) family NADH-FMN oxidoreductase RutF
MSSQAWISNEQLDAATLRRTFGGFPSGVVAVAAMSEGNPEVMAASSFTSVSLDPPLVSVCVAHSSTTWPKLRELARVGISVLSADQADLCRQISGAGERLAGVDWHTTSDGAILVEQAAVWLDCSLVSEVAAGDHSIAVLRVEAVSDLAGAAPLVFHGSQFRRLSSV